MHSRRDTIVYHSLSLWNNNQTISNTLIHFDVARMHRNGFGLECLAKLFSSANFNFALTERDMFYDILARYGRCAAFVSGCVVRVICDILFFAFSQHRQMKRRKKGNYGCSVNKFFFILFWLCRIHSTERNKTTTKYDEINNIRLVCLWVDYILTFSEHAVRVVTRTVSRLYLFRSQLYLTPFRFLCRCFY